ncbi:hypothetical protein OIU78_013203 [Salix suchowensis]|nr:hypothetical protein OIU78_013203 [Salix suchowensis]
MQSAPPPFPPDHTNMLGLHNILFIAPPPSCNHQQPPQGPSTHRITSTNVQYGIADNQESWTTLKKYPQESSFLERRPLNAVEDCDTAINNGPARACRDCGNRAKKECQYRRCRTCCKSGGYECTTHLKSTWVPAARRRERLGYSSGGGGGGGGSSASSSGGGCIGGKRPRDNANATSKSFSTSNNNAAASLNLDTGSSYQDGSFKQSLPVQVRAPAVFRCVRVTAINGGGAEVAYEAKVNIRDSSERNRDSSSPIVDPSEAYTATGNQRLLEELQEQSVIRTVEVKRLSGSCSCQNSHPCSHCVGHVSICDSRLLTSMNMQFKVKFGLPLISADGKMIMNVETEREWMPGYDFLKELASNRVNLNLEC